MVSVLAKAGERVEPVSARPGADAHEFNESHQPFDSRRIDGVFDAARIGFSLFGTELQVIYEKLLEHLVAADYLPRYLPPGRRESHKTVWTVIDQTPSRERLERACHRCALHAHLIGDVLCPCNTIGLLEMEDHFEVIFQACRQTVAVFATEHFIFSARSKVFKKYNRPKEAYFILELYVKQIARLPCNRVEGYGLRVAGLLLLPVGAGQKVVLINP